MKWCRCTNEERPPITYVESKLNKHNKWMSVCNKCGGVVSMQISTWEDMPCVFCGKVKPPSYPSETRRYKNKKYHQECLITELLKLRGEYSNDIRTI